MATREQVQELLHRGGSFQSVAQELGIAPGEAYMIATGQPADGAGGRFRADSDELPSSPQELLGVPPVNPTRNARVDAWIRARAARELSA